MYTLHFYRYTVLVSTCVYYTCVIHLCISIIYIYIHHKYITLYSLAPALFNTASLIEDRSEGGTRASRHARESAHRVRFRACLIATGTTFLPNLTSGTCCNREIGIIMEQRSKYG